jgi:hypothetical protein
MANALVGWLQGLEQRIARLESELAWYRARVPELECLPATHCEASLDLIDDASVERSLIAEERHESSVDPAG